MARPYELRKLEWDVIARWRAVEEESRASLRGESKPAPYIFEREEQARYVKQRIDQIALHLDRAMQHITLDTPQDEFRHFWQARRRLIALLDAWKAGNYRFAGNWQEARETRDAWYKLPGFRAFDKRRQQEPEYKAQRREYQAKHQRLAEVKAARAERQLHYQSTDAAKEKRARAKRIRYHRSQILIARDNIAWAKQSGADLRPFVAEFQKRADRLACELGWSEAQASEALSSALREMGMAS